MPPRTLSVEIDGKPVEVPVPDDYFHKDDLKESHIPKEHFSSELQTRVASITKGMRKVDEIMKDDEFLKNYVDTRRADLMKILNIEPGDKVDIAKIQTEAMDKVRREEVEPLRGQFSTTAQEVNDLRGRDLDAQVLMEANKIGVISDLLELVKLHVGKSFSYDPERKKWFQKKESGEEGYELSSDPKKGGAPYVTVTEFMDKLSRDPSKKAWFESRQQAGADFHGTRTRSGGPLTLEAYQKLSSSEKTAYAVDHPTEFGVLMEQLARTGENSLLSRAAR